MFLTFAGQFLSRSLQLHVSLFEENKDRVTFYNKRKYLWQEREKEK